MTEKGFRIASQATWFVQEGRPGFAREFLLWAFAKFREAYDWFFVSHQNLEVRIL